jgi:hypothetical protein
VITRRLILGFVWGLACIYCLTIPPALVFAWAGQLPKWQGREDSWPELLRCALGLSAWFLAKAWPVTLLLAGLIAWRLDLRSKALPRRSALHVSPSALP